MLQPERMTGLVKQRLEIVTALVERRRRVRRIDPDVAAGRYFGWGRRLVGISVGAAARTSGHIGEGDPDLAGRTVRNFGDGRRDVTVPDRDHDPVVGSLRGGEDAVGRI